MSRALRPRRRALRLFLCGVACVGRAKVTQGEREGMSRAAGSAASGKEISRESGTDSQGEGVGTLARRTKCFIDKEFGWGFLTFQKTCRLLCMGNGARSRTVRQGHILYSVDLLTISAPLPRTQVALCEV